MKHSLQLRLSQHLTLTPQLQQSIRLLQLSTLELNQELERFLQENPLLERDENVEAVAMPPGVNEPRATEAPAETPDAPAADSPAQSEQDVFAAARDEPYGGGGRDDGEDDDYPQLAAESPTLRHHLISQLSLTKLSDRDRTLVTLLIESLDEDGYLSVDLEELRAMLPEELEIEPEELQIALKHLQHFEPTGVGARNLGEGLALQLSAMPPDTPFREEALDVVRNHLETLAARDFARLRKVLRCDDTMLRGVQKLITSLNPRPGREYGSDETRYVVPDVIVRKVKGVWFAALNPDAMPRLRINRLYADILSRARSSG